MGSAGVSANAAIERVADELRSRDKFLLTAHEGPDGDALGSLLGMHHLLTQLGKDSVMFLAAKEFPLPIEYRFLPLEEVFHEPPADMADRTAIFLDCGNIDRMPVDFLSDGAHEIINIDHHHDNTHFGDLNLVDVEASCTAEIVYELALLLGVADHARDGLGALCRTDHRHRQVHVRQHQRPHPPDRRRPDRSGRRRRRHLPPPLRARPDREDQARRPCPRRHPAPLRRTPRPRLHHRRGLRGDRGGGGDDRGHHRPPAIGRGSRRSPP